MANNEISTINATEIKKMQPEALQKFAEEQSAIILVKVEECVKSLSKYQDMSFSSTELEGFDNIKNFFTAGNYKRDKDLTTLRTNLEKTHSETGKVMFNLLGLVQESVKFTCTSIELAQCMHRAMAAMMASGFKDSDGRMHKIDENAQEFANYILDQADTFVTNQQEFDSRMTSMEKLIEDFRKIEVEHDKKLDEAINATQNNASKIENILSVDNEQNEAIKAQRTKDLEHDQRLDNIDVTDKRQDEAIEAVALESKAKDNEQDNIINRLKDSLKSAWDAVSKHKEDIENNKDTFGKIEETIHSLQEKNQQEFNACHFELAEINKKISQIEESLSKTGNILEEKATNSKLYISYAIAGIALILAIIQFFI